MNGGNRQGPEPAKSNLRNRDRLCPDHGDPQCRPKVGDEVPLDPWGSEYGCGYPGARDPEDFEILSAGKDGVVGREDDLSSQDPS